MIFGSTAVVSLRVIERRGDRELSVRSRAKGWANEERDSLNVNLSTLLTSIHTPTTSRSSSKQPQELLPEEEDALLDVSLRSCEVREVGFDRGLEEKDFGLEEVELVQEEDLVGVAEVDRVGDL